MFAKKSNGTGCLLDYWIIYIAKCITVYWNIESINEIIIVNATNTILRKTHDI